MFNKKDSIQYKINRTDLIFKFNNQNRLTNTIPTFESVAVEQHLLNNNEIIENSEQIYEIINTVISIEPFLNCVKSSLLSVYSDSFIETFDECRANEFHLEDLLVRKSKFLRFICCNTTANRRRTRFNLFGFHKSKNEKYRDCHNLTDSCSIIKKKIFDHFNVILKRTSETTINQTCIMNQKHSMDCAIVKESEPLLFVAPRQYLLGPINLEDRFKKCCVIDLDETLVHSSFKELLKYDFKINVDIDGTRQDIYIVKRPYCDLFLSKMSILFECVMFTASLGKYANPVVDLIDKVETFRWRLFRESCIYFKNGFVKDLSMLGRAIDQIVIIDNSPISFMFHPQNAIQITSWFDDVQDRALLDLLPYCQRLSQSISVIDFLRLDQPPATATWPVSKTTKSSPRSLYSGLYIPIQLNQGLKSPITNISSRESMDLKKNSSSSSGSIKKSVLQNFPSLRSLFSRNLSPNTQERFSVHEEDLNLTTGKIFLNTDEAEKINNMSTIRKPFEKENKQRLIMNSPSTSSAIYGTQIKQNLNSASEVFSPKYYLRKERQLRSPRDSTNENFHFMSSRKAKNLLKRNKKHNEFKVSYHS